MDTMGGSEKLSDFAILKTFNQPLIGNARQLTFAEAEADHKKRKTRW